MDIYGQVKQLQNDLNQLIIDLQNTDDDVIDLEQLIELKSDTEVFVNQLNTQIIDMNKRFKD